MAEQKIHYSDFRIRLTFVCMNTGLVAEQILPKLSNKYIWWLIILSFNKLLLWKNGPKIIMLWCIPMSMLFTIEFAWPNTWQIPDWRTFISVTTYNEVQCVWILNLTSHKRTKRMKKYAHKNMYDFDMFGLRLSSACILFQVKSIFSEIGVRTWIQAIFRQITRPPLLGWPSWSTN